MIDFGRVIGFQWDDGNARKNELSHDVTQAEAEEVFENAPLVMPDIEHSKDEQRFNAFGYTAAGRRLHLTFTLREDNTLIRVISARAMSRKERNRYEQES